MSLWVFFAYERAWEGKEDRTKEVQPDKSVEEKVKEEERGT